ncbi:LLM class flavin-dependent oxidoreductase [Simiduia curdlanivorans]|uniref:MupA/Atu3671 family FMN-dependent luciferase-like monooxygenase n=1 Tax=Simiduia curdlanivorans TaxID=1492769 RepID=A0ABV8V910_9GAMM|nr:MupA/Atu3671 family FMN-dependent luciferase-like monooxygenase [Simiduia curdlanivorans]MDN3638514.1 LLM class flavin-dependent oxidoreductase [Simiduia curdlanivorans]
MTQVTNIANPFTCSIIGNGKLTLVCAQLLLAASHRIQAIVSDSAELRAWAEAHNIPVIEASGDVESFLEQREFAYLFSVINLNKISARLLAMPTKLAINFHDAPLPRYAGLHVTSWAIANQESTFGVTWHEMNTEFDAGRILKQVEFPIEAGETAFSLNVKCFTKARETFIELIQELAEDRPTFRSQDLTARTVFPRARRPNAIIDWSQPGQKISALLRSLSYMPDANPMALPKVLIGRRFYSIAEAGFRTFAHTAPVGAIVSIDASGVDVAVTGGIVQLKTLLLHDATLIAAGQLAVDIHLTTGAQLPLVEVAVSASIHAAYQQAGLNEPYWLTRLAQAEPFLFPEQVQEQVASQYSESVELLSSQQQEQLTASFPELEPSIIFAALYYCFLTRLAGESAFDIGLAYPSMASAQIEFDQLFCRRIPFRASLDGTNKIGVLVKNLADLLGAAKAKGFYTRDVFARQPDVVPVQLPVSVVIADAGVVEPPELGDALVLVVPQGGNGYRWRFNNELLPAPVVSRVQAGFKVFLTQAIANPLLALNDLPMISESEKNQLLLEWNQTQRPYDAAHCVHQLIEAQAQLRPEAVALVFKENHLSYRELDQRATQLAIKLQAAGAKPDVLVGVFLHRSIEMVIGLLAILKAGAAYVPLDPHYPRDRIALMVDDANLPILITHSRLRDELPNNRAHICCVDQVASDSVGGVGATLAPVDMSPNNLAYVIYTSGSTGRPKGVMIEHRNVMNFFAGMDDTLDYQGEPGVWLAVTSISFDISVLEIFWTLSRGFKVVIQEDEAPSLASVSASTEARHMDVGLFYFSSDAGPSANNNRYKLLLEGAKFADTHGFSSVWTPERHFHLFGGLYPNPSVTSAAIAAVTTNVAIRAGSIVLPLHNPVRVVEEWSVVDNISGGRVGFSFASGWHANDFTLQPENFENRKQIMFDSIDKVRDLWAGKSVAMISGEGKPFNARVYPEPVQKEPPIWITTAGNVDTFRQAGEGGFNILTNLLGQSIEDIQAKIAAYREGRRRNGHQGDGIVSVMVHTFLGVDVDEVREIVREPFCQYLKTSFDLVKIAPWAFPAFRQPSKSAATDPSFDANSLTSEDLDALLDHAFDRYFETAGVFGTPQSCLPLIERLKRAGVDEIACLIDFGVDDDQVLESLVHLNTLRELSLPKQGTHAARAEDFSVAAQIRRHQVTHFQCTPSMARMLAADSDALSSLSNVKKVLLGGEALPMDLVGLLAPVLTGDLINVYGPTETTIWSTSSLVARAARDVSIGKPIANTLIYILDSALHPVPVGAQGELYIGGQGVVRGYLGRPDLTADRFVPNPFVDDPKAKMYRTGDLVRYKHSGDIEYLSRLDHQVKLRGYRIELGEIESLICADPEVRDSVVVVAEMENKVQSLVAYIVPKLANLIQHTSGSVASSSDTTDSEINNLATGHWQSIWNETYQSGSHSRAGELHEISDDPTLNTAGWLNSYTGEQHPQGQMLEWVNATTERILALKPRRVLEIGCGTGMVLFRVAPHCEAYVGVDFSSQALATIEQKLTALELDNVELVQSTADQLALAHAEPFDLVVINSVLQYFPSARYVSKVLKRVFSLLADNGKVFVGDVRSYAHMEIFHHSLALATTPPTTAVSQLQARVEEYRQREAELLIDPDFFSALQSELPALSHINIQLKRGAYHNEMSMYRYDVYLSKGKVNADLTDADFKTLPSVANLVDLQQLLAQASSCVVVRDIVNPRIAAHALVSDLIKEPASFATVSDLQARIAEVTPSGIDPEQLYRLDAGWQVQLSWARSGLKQCYDAYFIPSRHGGSLQHVPIDKLKPLNQHCFEPKAHGVEFMLIDRVRAALRENLPAFMVPSEYLILPKLPLTPNGKIDRKALPRPEKRRREAKADFVAPQGDIEQAIASVLQDMLNIEKIGTKDNFTDLGANSLLMVQANNRLSQLLDRKVSLVSMYRYPTIASLAEYLKGDANDKQGLEKGQQRGEQRKAAQAGRRQRLISTRK